MPHLIEPGGEEQKNEDDGSIIKAYDKGLVEVTEAIEVDDESYTSEDQGAAFKHEGVLPNQVADFRHENELQDEGAAFESEDDGEDSNKDQPCEED